MVSHGQCERAPKVAIVFFVVGERQCLHERVAAIVELDLAELMVALVDPNDLLCIPRVSILRHALDNVAC